VPDLTVRTEVVEEAHITPYAELSYVEYGDAPIANASHLRWKFLENPQGAPVGIHLFSGDRLVGRLVAQPRRFTFPDGSEQTAAFMVDLLIHPDFRSITALAKLIGGLRSLAERFDFVIVTPNATGDQVWRNLVKLPERFELGAFAAPLRPGKLARLPAWTKLATNAADALSTTLTRAIAYAFRGSITVDEAWPDAAELRTLCSVPSHTIRGSRDGAFLTWRFRNSPVFNYRMHFVRKRGRLLAYIATRTTTYAGYHCTFIVDAFGAPDCTAEDWSAARWKLLDMDAMSGGADALMIVGNARCGGLSRLARLPFTRIPDALMPQRVPLFGASWKSDSGVSFDSSIFEFTLADCDVV